MAGFTVEWSAFKGIDPANASVVTVECTVVTGFEREAEKEARLKLGLESVEKTQGRQGSTSSVSTRSLVYKGCMKKDEDSSLSFML